MHVIAVDGQAPPLHCLYLKRRSLAADVGGKLFAHLM
jgi:hypothetical protein